MDLTRVTEALLFSAQKPLSTKEIIDALRNAGGEDEFSPNEFANVRQAEVAAAKVRAQAAIVFSFIANLLSPMAMERCSGHCRDVISIVAGGGSKVFNIQSGRDGWPEV